MKESRKRSAKVRTREIPMENRRRRNKKVTGMITMRKVTRLTSRKKMLRLMIRKKVTSRLIRGTSLKKWMRKGRFLLAIRKMKGQKKKKKDKMRVSKRWMLNKKARQVRI